jgi:hypothetical protein
MPPADAPNPTTGKGRLLWGKRFAEFDFLGIGAVPDIINLEGDDPPKLASTDAWSLRRTN